MLSKKSRSRVVKGGSTVPGKWKSLKVVRLTRFLQGKFVVNPARLNLRNDERSPSKSIPGKLGARVRSKSRLIFSFLRSGVGQVKCLLRSARISEGPQMVSEPSRLICGVARRRASAQ